METVLEMLLEDTYDNLCEEGSHKFKKLTEKDFNKMANNIIENGEFWDIIDEFMLEQINKYEI